MYKLKLLIIAIVSVTVESQTDTSTPATEAITTLWSLTPCQSAFQIPTTSSEFDQNWITYQYEGNTLSQFGECVFTMESDLNTRIEMRIHEVHLFDNERRVPLPCLLLYDVKADGNLVQLRRECRTLSVNLTESVPTITEANLAVISTSIRYGSFQLRVRAVPRSYRLASKDLKSRRSEVSSHEIPS